MLALDLIDLFIGVWVKPIVILGALISVANTSYRHCSAASHWLLVTGLIITALATLTFVPSLALGGSSGPMSIPLAFIPQAFEPLTHYLVYQTRVDPLSFPNNMSAILFGVYILFAAWIASFQLIAMFDIARVTKQAKRLDLPSVNLQLEKLRKQFSIRRKVRLVVSEKIASPVMWGAMYPVILLPESYTEWSEQRLTRVLAHELAHVSRQDWLIKVLLKFLCAMLWLVPVVWMVTKKIEWLAELSCDDKVINALDCRAEYAQDLLDLSVDKQYSNMMVSLIHSSAMYQRLDHILDGGNHRLELSRRAKCFNLLTCALCIFPLTLIDTKVSQENHWLSEDLPSEVLLWIEQGVKQKPLNHSEQRKYQNGDIDRLEDIRKLRHLVLREHVPTRPEEELIVSLSREEDLEGWLTKDVAYRSKQKIPITGPNTFFPNTVVEGILPQKMVTPEYPSRAISRGVEGVVEVVFDIARDGRVKNIVIERSFPDSIFDRAVKKALLRSQYRPMQLDGEPITIKNVSQTYTFKLYQEATDKTRHKINPSHKVTNDSSI